LPQIAAGSVAGPGQYRDRLVVPRGRVSVESFDAAEPPAGDLTDCIKDRRFENIGAADRTDGAADAIPPIMAAQGTLAPAIGRLQQIDDRIELLQRLVVAETGPVKRHSANPPPSCWKGRAPGQHSSAGGGSPRSRKTKFWLI